jgi:hypothetical protein
VNCYAIVGNFVNADGCDLGQEISWVEVTLGSKEYVRILNGTWEKLESEFVGWIHVDKDNI